MRVLALRTEGVGNAILSTPCFASLKRNLPGVMLDVWVDSRAYELLLEHSYIDHLFQWPKVPTNGPYDVGLVLVFDGGLMTEAASRICKKLVRHPHVDFHHKAEALHNLEIVGQIGGWDGRFYPTSLYIPEANFLFASEKLNAFLCQSDSVPLIGISVGCETSVPVHRKRFWKNERWLELIKQLHRKYKANFIFLGGKSEERETTELVNSLPKGILILNLLKQTTIKQAAAIIKACTLFISIDSGLMHLATVVGTKMVSLWGPTSEVKSQPWTSQERYAVVRDHSLSCKRCYTGNPALFQQCSNQFCMKNIRVEDVIRVIQERNFL